MESRKNKQLHTLCHDKILSDDVLFKHRKPCDKTVPQRGGDKDFSPDDSWLQAKRLEKFYEERRNVLAEPRVERLGSIVTGEWNPDIQLVELHKEMGKFWSSMGFTDKNRKWLHPEEALFLMETVSISSLSQGLPVSIQQAYAVFLKNLGFEEYLVYAHLKRIGYVVLRHQGRFEKEGDNSKSTVYNNWNFKDIIFPDYGDPLNVQFGGGVPQRYFPPGIPSFSLEKVDREQVLKQRLKLQKNQQTGVKYGQELDSSNLVFSCENPIKKISASNWREYKERLRESLESQSLTFQSTLEQVVPLVRPEDATDTISVLKKLQIIPQWEGSPESANKTEERPGLPKVSYDVFKPDAKFRKSNPGVPDHRVCVVRSEEDPPSLSALTSLYSYYDDDIPLHWAVVDNGEIAFYSFSQISFPTQVFMG
uniref:tRNA-splicing endonuclease subunit Sen54-like n=1 Tax=Crassostrea virginica TaxID=6565 RepID=A0A8B8CLN8_CRAVI|nr:tRNA-splicing endonuclease subunit Sen54-like [Crassostrea virginica]